jgi:hypothetical protein
MGIRDRLASVAADLVDRPPLQSLYRRLIAEHVPGRSFVDVGCMWNVHGAYAFHAVTSGATEVSGVDLMPPTSEFVRGNAALGNKVRFVCGDVNDANLVADVRRHDVVFCSGVVYHVPNPLLTLERLRALCGRTLILGSATMRERSQPQSAVFLPFLSDRGRRRVGYETPHHKVGLDDEYRSDDAYANWFWLFTPSCLAAMLRVAGFEITARYTYRHAACFVCTVSS